MTIDRVLPMSLEAGDTILLAGSTYTIIEEIDTDDRDYTFHVWDDREQTRTLVLEDNKKVTLLL